MQASVDVLFSFIVQQYFLNSRCLITFTDEGSVPNLNQNIPFVNIRVDGNNIHPEIIFRYFGCQGIVISSKEPVTVFKNFEKEIRLKSERWNFRKFLILQCEDKTENIFDVFNTKEMEYIADVLVVELKLDEQRILLWTNKYIGKNNHNERILVDAWFTNNNSFQFGTDLFANKLGKQQGRHFRLSTLQYEPYSILGPNEEDLKGSEMMTAVEFAKKYDMTPVTVVDMNDTWGEIYGEWIGDGWRGTGVLGNLGRDDGDIGFASMATWTVYYDFLDFSKPSVRTGVTGLVPAPKLAPRWLIPFYSYSRTMWLTVGILFFTCIITLSAMRYWAPIRISREEKVFSDNMVNLLNSSIWSILKLFVVQPVNDWEIATGINGGLFMSLVFLASLFLSTTYSSGFSSIMTIPLYEHPINTVLDFYESGLKWGATGNAWIESLRGAEDHITKEIVRRFIAVPEEELLELSLTYNFAFAMERLPNRNFAVGAYVDNNVIDGYRVMVEDFYWEHCIFMLRKSSILLPLFDAFLLRAFETGHINHWQNEAIMQYMDFKVQKIVEFYNYQHQVEHVVEKITITHLEGAFAILNIGLLTSTISFIIEILIYRCID